MFLIASNISTRHPAIERLFRQAGAGGWDLGSGAAIQLITLARDCAGAGAGAIEINTQQHHDEPAAMQFAVKAVQEGTDLPLCLSSNHPLVIETGLQACRRPPLVNYLGIDEKRLRGVLPPAADHNASLVLLVSDPAAPTDAREMLNKAAILIGAANAAGISNDRILVDPGLIHVTAADGQRHLAEVLEFLRALPEAIDPPVRSTVWLGNSSSGAAARLRPAIESALLSMLAGAGLSSVFMDVLRKENRRAARLIRVFSNEIVYSDGELS